MRSILYYVGYMEDMVKVSKTAEDRARYQGIIDVLIPVAKGYITDRAFDLCSDGVQIFGGYGFTKEYPQEQLLRDCKITQIYEGTNGIQAMDLLGRKLGLNKGKAFTDLLGEVGGTIETAKGIGGLDDQAAGLQAALSKLMETAKSLGGLMGAGKIETAFAHAHPFLDVTGDVLMAWMLLWRATIAADKLAGKPKKKDMAFYKGILASARFFTASVLPVTLGKIHTIMAAANAAMDIEEDAFASK